MIRGWLIRLRFSSGVLRFYMPWHSTKQIGRYAMA